MLAVATLGLAGCGRKGPLDLPPTASGAAAQADAEPERPASKGTIFDPTYGADNLPATPKGGKKGFILDPLLGN